MILQLPAGYEVCLLNFPIKQKVPDKTYLKSCQGRMIAVPPLFAAYPVKNKGGFPNQKIRHQLCNISMIQKISLRYLTPVTWGYGAATSLCVHLASYESIPFKLSCLLSPPQTLCEESPDVLLSLIDFVIFNYFGVYPINVSMSTPFLKKYKILLGASPASYFLKFGPRFPSLWCFLHSAM